ncbi:MAG: hypothetical protein M3076_11435 [Actinomycetota bacterium]|nr:hypothetical protein [Actinomycetota bacterium]
MLDLALRLRSRILPELGSHAGRARAGDAMGGDVTFAVDARAETELAEFMASVGGGLFELGSQAYAMTRIVTGQFDAVIEVGSRLIDEIPGLRAEFERIGGGHVLNNSPYDLAGPWLCLREAGGIVSDGWGRPLDGYRLLGSGHDFQMSSISAANAELHGKLVREIDAGIERLRAMRG